ncbi:PHP domain-containing protein [Neptunicella marina]|uniref:PHP domain-containing protein n=1 Tax=Neptunicella marina TaxID=2125989 RepID=UPI001888702A|nr:PHP domain-containing protein [Neptunicella marina]
MSKIDLHCHSHFSDGRLSIEELIDRAHNMQVDVLAITDHDTVAGIQSAMNYQSGQKRAMTLIPGVEISTGWHNFDIHILGLNLDYRDARLIERLELQGQSRDERARKIAEKLEKAGVAGCYERAREIAGVGQITRAHFARVLLEKGVVDSLEKAFKKYLGKGERAHVKPQWIDIPTAIKWIHDAGGKAVLAHPGHYDLSAKWLRRLIVEFKQSGGDGIEVIHSHLSPQRKQQMVDYATEYQLEASAGSDFHFPNRWTELGKNLSLPEQVVPIWHNWIFKPLSKRESA